MGPPAARGSLAGSAADGLEDGVAVALRLGVLEQAAHRLLLSILSALGRRVAGSAEILDQGHVAVCYSHPRP
jgi:hypothetical protein